jgi:serine/threonine protein kinase
MTGRWKEIEPILDAALARAPHERAAIIADACDGDEALRREVESLLAQESAADHLFGTPGFVLAAGSFDPEARDGRVIGPYVIRGLLGAGGMGEVYRAHDMQLDRDVAIKILPSAFTSDPDRLARFAREARTLAALNHPRIAAIYGFEYGGGMPALVLELVEGPTLADRLSDGPLALADVVGIAAQITEALEAAHAQQIIHRDLKPANIKITSAGSVKLLDFGLAKSLGRAESPEVTGTGHLPLTASSPGALLGTAAYMSPEQADGRDVDSRSDLFSLGAVLYEMLTGQPAFAGETLEEVLNAILTQQPPSPRTINGTIPPALDRLVMRLLAKDRAARYQAAHDVRVELQRLSRELDAGSPRTRRRWREQSAAAALVIAVTLAAAGWIWWRQTSGATPVEPKYTQITHFADSATSPALSSDGRWLTFVRGPSTFHGRGQIYVKALPDGEPIQLTSDPLAKMDPVFSPDNSRIVYTSVTSQFAWDTWTVPVRGGEARRWLPNASGLTWLRDGRLIFSEQTGGLHMRITTADEQRNAVRLLYSPAGEHGMAHRSALSPDGRWVLVAEMDSAVWQPCRLLPVDGNSVGRRVGPGGQCTSSAWSPDGQWMYFSANTTGTFHLWRQRFPNGAPEQLTSGPTEAEGIAPDPDGRSVMTSVGTRHQSIWIRDERGEREISREGYAFVPSIPNAGTSQPLPGDGRSVFYLVRQGAVRFSGPGERAGELWATDLATGRHRLILPGRQVIGYDVSRDGRRIAFAALDERGTSHVWLAELDRPDTARRLTAFEADSPRFDVHGDVLCRGVDDGRHFIYRLREGRQPKKAISSPVLFFHAPSPDGAWILAKVGRADREAGYLASMAFPLSGGSPVPLCDTCEVDWTPDGRSLVIRFAPSDPTAQRRSVLVTLESGSVVPRWPAQGIRSRDDLNRLQIAREFEDWVYPSGSGSTYVFERRTTQRNIYRLAIPVD